MDKFCPPIVVVAFNRPESLSRLLQSLDSAAYPNEQITLIISIDRAENNKNVLEIANQFKWRFGEKKVIYQKKNLGLRKHILQCGAYSESYGSVIILEDDLFVSPFFYDFVQHSLNFSNDKESIGGISLYNHELNVHTNDNFRALDDGFDNWYFQFASSWGQAWSRNQWKGFIKWYNDKPKINDDERIPQNVRNWSEKSWLKYFTAYLITKDLYFLYPKTSFTTNFSDVGTHVGIRSTAYQVPLQHGKKNEFNFSDLDESKSTYDAFFENLYLNKILGLNRKNLTIDLYGYHSLEPHRYIISSRILDYEIQRSYGCFLKPIECNILMDIEGSDFFLYDTNVQIVNNIRINNLNKILFNIKVLSFKQSYLLFFSKIRQAISRIVYKIRSFFTG